MEGVPEIGGVPPAARAEIQPAIVTQKEQRWREVKKEFTKDKLGHESDAGIVDTVVGLNVLGVNTDKSCEGHIDRGTGAPYIDIAAKDTIDASQIYEMFAKEETRDAGKKLSEETTRLNLKEREKLMGHLSDFYQNRQVPYDTRLIIQSNPLGVSRLESQGAGVQGIATPEVKQQRLQAYQKEMNEFALFLEKGVNLSAASSDLQNKQQGEAVPIAPTVKPVVVEKVEQKVDLSEVKTKLEKAYLEEKRQRLLSMTPFWLACSQVLNQPPNEIRQFTSQCNPSRVKAIIEAGAKGMEGDGYTYNISKLTANFGGTAEPIVQVREEVIESIKELAPLLSSDKAIENQIKSVGSSLKDLASRSSMLAFFLHPASFNVIKERTPEWGSSVADNLAWLTIAKALEKYMVLHLSRRMRKPI